MKKVYINPAIRIQSIEVEDIMESISMVVIDSENEEEIITDGSEVLSNGNSVWDD